MAIYKIIINGEFGERDTWFTIRLQSDAEWVIPKQVRGVNFVDLGAETIRFGGNEQIFMQLNSKSFMSSFRPLSKLQKCELYAETDAPILAIEAEVPSNSSTLTVSSSVDSYVRKADITGQPNSFHFDLRLV